MGTETAPLSEQCATTAKTSEWERAGYKTGGPGGLPPALFLPISREKWGPPPGRRGPGALRPEAPEKPRPPEGYVVPYRAPARDRAGNRVAGLDLRRSRRDHLPTAEARQRSSSRPRGPAGALHRPLVTQVAAAPLHAPDVVDLGVAHGLQPVGGLGAGLPAVGADEEGDVVVRQEIPHPVQLGEGEVPAARDVPPGIELGGPDVQQYRAGGVLKVPDAPVDIHTEEMVEDSHSNSFPVGAWPRNGALSLSLCYPISRGKTVTQSHCAGLTNALGWDTINSPPQAPVAQVDRAAAS